jgi:RNA polymerase sigma factor (sigma-70 family)
MDALRDADAFCAELCPRLVGSMVLYTGDRLLAEELAQEALARALERWERVGRMASPEAWTYRTAFNLVRSSFRRRRLERRARIHETGVIEDLPDAASAIAVRQAVLALPPRQRAAIVARYFLGLSVDEAADALGCASGTVKALTSQAILSLRGAGLGNDEEVEVDASPR